MGNTGLGRVLRKRRGGVSGVEAALRLMGKTEATMCGPRGGGRAVLQGEALRVFPCSDFRLHERIHFCCCCGCYLCLLTDNNA